MNCRSFVPRGGGGAKKLTTVPVYYSGMINFTNPRYANIYSSRTLFGYIPYRSSQQDVTHKYIFIEMSIHRVAAALLHYSCNPFAVIYSLTSLSPLSYVFFLFSSLPLFHIFSPNNIGRYFFSFSPGEGGYFPVLTPLDAIGNGGGGVCSADLRLDNFYKRP